MEEDDQLKMEDSPSPLPPPVKTLDTKGFCIFCLRKVEGVAGADADHDHNKKIEKTGKVFRSTKQEETIRRFSKQIGRYLNVDFVGDEGDDNLDVILEGDHGGAGTGSKRKANDDDYLNERFEKDKFLDFGVACNDCYYVLDGFCRIHLKLEEMELMLQWQVRKLKDIVALSTKAPSRVRNFQKELSMMIAERGDEDGTKLKEIEVFRKKFLRKCNLKFQSTRPRIHLKRKKPDPADDTYKRRRLPGHVIGEEDRKRKVEDSQPIIASIIKQEPGLEPVPTTTSSAEDASDHFMETEVILSPTYNEASTTTQQNFSEFDAHEEHNEIDIDYEYSTTEKKILPQATVPDSSCSMTTSTTSTTAIPSPVVVPLPSNLAKLVRFVTNLKSKTKTNDTEEVQNVEESTPSPAAAEPETENNEISDHVQAVSPVPEPFDENGNHDETMDSSTMTTVEGTKTTHEIIETGTSETVVNENDGLASTPSASDETGDSIGRQQQESEEDSDATNPKQSENDSSPPPKIVSVTTNVEPKMPDKQAGESFLKPIEAICSICNEKFSSPALLAPHMYTHTDPRSWPFHCKYCNQRFYRVADFKRHRVSVSHLKNKKVHKTNKNNNHQPEPPQTRRGHPPQPSPMKRPASRNEPEPSSSKVIVLDPTTASGLGDRKNVKVVRIIYKQKDNSLTTPKKVTNDGGSDKGYTIIVNGNNIKNVSRTPDRNADPSAEVVTID